MSYFSLMCVVATTVSARVATVKVDSATDRCSVSQLYALGSWSMPVWEMTSEFWLLMLPIGVFG